MQAILWVSCGPARVVISRGFAHAGGSWSIRAGNHHQATTEAIMSRFNATTRHARYVLGSLTAVLFAICVGNS
jgi:hypothetical protein